MTTSIEIIKSESKCKLDGLQKRHVNGFLSDSKWHILMISTDSIFPNPNQPRTSFDDDSIIRLADSIRRYGIIHPISVRAIENGNYADPSYEIIAGERRYRAAKLLKMSEIPCRVLRADVIRSAEMALIENIQRKDLNFFEQASAIFTLVDSYHLTQDEVAKRLSVSQSFVANKLRLLRLTPEERNKILSHSLSERHARTLIRIDDVELRSRVLQYIIENSLNVATAESYIDRLLSDAASSDRHKIPKKLVLKDIRIFFNTVDRAVSIVKQAGIHITSERHDEGDSSVITIRIPNVSRETFE